MFRLTVGLVLLIACCAVVLSTSSPPRDADEVAFDYAKVGDDESPLVIDEAPPPPINLGEVSPPINLGEDGPPLMIHNIHILNQHKIHMNGLGPWTDRLDMYSPEGSACFGSRVTIRIDGVAKTLTVSHYGEGFVGVFRTSEDVQSLYPEQKILTAIEHRLPFGVDQDGEAIAVEENDILFCVLPHKQNWHMKPVDLQGAMYGMDPSDRKAFGQWAQKMILMLKDSRATIVLASIGRMHPVQRPDSFNVMYSQNYQRAFKKVHNPQAKNYSSDDEESSEEGVYSDSDDSDDVILLGFRESVPRGSGSSSSLSSSSRSSDDYGDALARLFGDEPPQQAPVPVIDANRPSASIVHAFLRQWIGNLDADSGNSDDSDGADSNEEDQRPDNEALNWYLNGGDDSGEDGDGGNDAVQSPAPANAERIVVGARRRITPRTSEVVVVTPLGGHSRQAEMLATNGCAFVLFLVSAYVFLQIYTQLNSIQDVYIHIY